MRCHSEDVVVSWVGQLRAPAPRLSSNPVIEEKACRTGGPSRLLRVVSLDYSARALLWLAKRARDWVRLGIPLAVARRGAGLASRRMCNPSSGVCRHLRYASTLGRARVQAPRHAWYPGRARWSKHRPSWSAVVGAEGHRSGRSSESRREPAGGASASGVRRSGPALDAGVFVSCGCGSQVALDPALSRLSAEPLRAGRSAPFF